MWDCLSGIVREVVLFQRPLLRKFKNCAGFVITRPGLNLKIYRVLCFTGFEPNQVTSLQNMPYATLARFSAIVQTFQIQILEEITRGFPKEVLGGADWNC